MRCKVLKFWAKLDTNHLLTPTGDFLKKADCYYCLLQIPHHNNTMFRKIIKVDHKTKGFITSGQIGQSLFLGEIEYSYFCHSIVLHDT